MYTKKNIVIIETVTNQERQDIKDFSYAREREQPFEIIDNDFIKKKEDILSCVDVYIKEIGISGTVLTQFIARDTNKLYPFLKESGLLYEPLKKISSRMKKVNFFEKFDSVTEKTVSVIRKEKEVQVKSNSVYAKLVFPRQQRYINY